MKAFAYILSACISLSCISCSQDYNKLKDSETDTQKVQMAKKFANDYFTQLKNGSYYQFHDEAVENLKNFLTEEYQKSSYHQITEQFGNYQTLEYAETWALRSNPGVLIVRLKSDFEKSRKKLEIRVVLNESGRISGFWLRPWSDVLEEQVIGIFN